MNLIVSITICILLIAIVASVAYGKSTTNDKILKPASKSKSKGTAFGTSRQDLAKDLTRRRILSELRDIRSQMLTLDVPFNSSNPDECGVRLGPVKNKLLEWHFSFQGVQDSPYEGGIYHGCILLDASYPRKAPSITIFTPNGRWEVGKAICLSASSYHQETWSPSGWNLRTLVTALRMYMLTNSNEIGAISTSNDTKRRLAEISNLHYCRLCNTHHSHLNKHHQHQSNASVEEN